MLDFIQDYENHLINVKHASGNTISSYMRDIRQFSTWILQNEGISVLKANQDIITPRHNSLFADSRVVGAEQGDDGWRTKRTQPDGPLYEFALPRVR